MRDIVLFFGGVFLVNSQSGSATRTIGAALIANVVAKVADRSFDPVPVFSNGAAQTYKG